MRNIDTLNCFEECSHVAQHHSAIFLSSESFPKISSDSHFLCSGVSQHHEDIPKRFEVKEALPSLEVQMSAVVNAHHCLVELLI
jgi:hypothetical protein